MRISLVLSGVLVLSACATQEPQVDRAAVDDYIAVRGLKQVDVIYMSNNSYGDIARPLNDYHLRYKTRQNYYLIVFAQRCPAKYGTVTTDVRNNNVLRAQADTIRGCRISSIYRLTKEESDELRTLGQAPASPK